MSAPSDAAFDVPILYRDARLCVVMKPAGLAVHRGWAKADHYALDLVRDALGQRVHPVHRLDQPTSGALCFALDPAAARDLCDQLARQAVGKRYLALVRGLVPPQPDRIDHPLADEPGDPARPAVTVIRGLGSCLDRYGLVVAEPEHGRLHQIRRHLKHRSRHVIGDVRYGKGEHNRLFRDRFGLHRLALHALDLAFRHPDDGRPMAIQAPVPADLAEPLAAAGLALSPLIAALPPLPEPPPCPTA
jgi:tRNA pseudouridine65 synthase